ncbi:MAG: hypothetical protein BWX48_02658 [Verrucomicrobia bacterium ADurb.Bin006]|nr:MAG: hypothetical protein BWX48_02658 [Verrucomicrobia bacterium ADurb.Bin006]
MVDIIGVVTGDSHLVPTFRFARRKGVRVVLDHMGHDVPLQLLHQPVPPKGTGRRSAAERSEVRREAVDPNFHPNRCPRTLKPPAQFTLKAPLRPLSPLIFLPIGVDTATKVLEHPTSSFRPVD